MKSDASDPQLYTLDINPEVSKIATAGSDPVIKIYDEEKRVLDIDLNGDGSVRPGHNNRIYCVKFVKDEPHMLLSGGWDYRVITWDLREGKPVRDINGPLICGDGIDIFEDKVLTASWTQANQLQLWDYPEGTLNKTIDWDSVLKTSEDPVKLYCGQFSKVDGCLILAGGSNTDEAKMFDRNNYEKPFFALNELSAEINSVDFANRGGKFLTAGGDGLLRVFSLNIIA